MFSHSHQFLFGVSCAKFVILSDIQISGSVVTSLLKLFIDVPNALPLAHEAQTHRNQFRQRSCLFSQNRGWKARYKASASFAPRPFVAFKAKGLRMFALGGPNMQVEII